MAGLTLTNALARVRLLCLDTDATDQSFTDAQLTSLLDGWYQWWYATYSAQLLADTTTLSFSSGNTNKTWTTSDNQPLTIAMVRASATGEGTNILKRAELSDLLALQLLHAAGSSTSTAESGLPTQYAIQPVSPGVGVDNVYPMTFNIFVYPIPDATTTVTIYHRPEPDTLTNGTDIMRLTTAEAYAVCRLTALDASAMLGAPDAHIQALARSLPDDAKRALGFQSEMLRPNPTQAGKVNV